MDGWMDGWMDAINYGNMVMEMKLTVDLSQILGVNI